MLLIGGGALADAVAAALAGAGWAIDKQADHVFLFAGASDVVDHLIGQMRTASPIAGGSVILIIAPEVAALIRAMLIAAIETLASERAPRIRVSAIDSGAGADPDAVAAAALFLAQATGTTGQVIRIAAD